MISRISFIVAAFCLLLAAPRPAPAADAGDFDSLVNSAQDGYRAALFYARTGNPALAGIELHQAQAVWDEILTKYGAAPPKAYANDTQFAADLKAITGRIARGADLLDAEKSKDARLELEPVRDLIYGLRDRAGRKGYPECVTDLNRHMAVLFKWRHARPDFSIPGVTDDVMQSALKYRDTLRACRAMAPEAKRKADDFKRIYDGADASISSMPAAVERKDSLGVVNILRELMSFDRILYFKLG